MPSSLYPASNNYAIHIEQNSAEPCALPSLMMTYVRVPFILFTSRGGLSWRGRSPTERHLFSADDAEQRTIAVIFKRGRLGCQVGTVPLGWCDSPKRHWPRKPCTHFINESSIMVNACALTGLRKTSHTYSQRSGVSDASSTHSEPHSEVVLKNFRTVEEFLIITRFSDKDIKISNYVMGNS